MENLLPSDEGPFLVSSVELLQGVASLSRGAYLSESSLELALSVLTESAGRMSGVERASIWALTDNHRELRCIELFELASGRHSSGGSVLAERYPAYFEALEDGGSIVADDPYSHPATAEFGSDYLPRHGISAMLDTPIYIRGQLQGVFCLEQVGRRQPWTPIHGLFARIVANLVTLALVEFEAGEARRDVQLANERLDAVFAASRDALMLVDAGSGLILDLNAKAENLFGNNRRNLLGRHQGRLHPPAQQEAMGYEFRQMLAGQLGRPWITEVQRPDGTVVSVEMSAEPVQAGGGRHYVLACYRPLQ